MKKQYLFVVSLTLLFSLTACNSEPAPVNPETPLLSLYDADAKFVSGGYGKDVNGNDEWLPLATYRHKNNGEAPYVEIGEFLNVLNLTFHNRINYDTMSTTRLTEYDSSIEKISEHLYGIYSEDVLGATLETNTNVFTIKRFDYMFTQSDSFNGILRNDLATPNNSTMSMVHGSPYSTYLGKFKEEVYDLDEYKMDIVEKDNKVYMPAQFLSNTFLRGLGADFVYNGNDFFLSSSVGSAANTNVSASFRSSNNTFEMYGALHTSVTPLANEEYRYVATLPTEQNEPASYSVFSLIKDGHGFAFTSNDKDATSSENPTYQLDYEKKNNDLYLTLYSKNPTGTFATFGHVMRISSNETFYNKKTRSKALSEFNYELLRFQIDNYYGLKDEFNKKHGFVDFDSFVTSKGLKDKLLSTDTRTYDEGLSEFLMGYIDDGHTKYQDRTIFSGIEEKTANDLSNEYMGPRRGTLLSKHEEYVSYRESVLGKDNEPIGVFFEGETAVIRFDTFMHLLPIISNPGSSMDGFDIATLFNGSSPFGFMRAFKEISTHNEIKNVVVDLTCNGGGMVLTLPFLAAYFTKDPTIYLRDNLEGVVREFHYDVDLNGDGVYRGEGDYYGDKYHIYLLTSDFSFSCASALPTMAHIANVDIIGVQCAGGACNVAGFSDACGSIYTLSAPQQIGYLDKDGNFVNDDAGIPVTHELAKENWYDLVKLNEAVTGFSNN